MGPYMGTKYGKKMDRAWSPAPGHVMDIFRPGIGKILSGAPAFLGGSARKKRENARDSLPIPVRDMVMTWSVAGQHFKTVFLTYLVLWYRRLAHRETYQDGRGGAAVQHRIPVPVKARTGRRSTHTGVPDDRWPKYIECRRGGEVSEDRTGPDGSRSRKITPPMDGQLLDDSFGMFGKERGPSRVRESVIQRIINSQLYYRACHRQVQGVSKPLSTGTPSYKPGYER